MQTKNFTIAFLISIFALNSAGATETARSNGNVPKRLMLMDFKLMGATGEAKLDAEHQARLKLANAELRAKLVGSQQFALADEATSTQFNQQVSAALKNNACDSCELTLAKEQGIQQILYPWVFKLSNLVLTLYVVIIDAETNKTVNKKVHDFRGDNDQSWQRVIHYFVKNLNSK